MADINVTAFNDYKALWKNVVVKSGLVLQAYWPYYDTYVNQVTPPTAGINETDYNKKITDLADKIKLYFINAQYGGNKIVLVRRINETKPNYVRVQTTAPFNQNAANVTAFNNYKGFWRNVVVQSGQVGQAYWPYYDTYVNKVSPPQPGISKNDFVDKINELAEQIKLYFVNAQYSGNKVVLSQQIDASKPNYPGGQVDFAPVPTTVAPTPTTVAADMIFKGEGGIGPAVNYRTTFESMKALANSDIMDIDGLLKGTAAPAALAAISAKVDADIDTIQKKKMAREATIDAMNQQFVDERSATGKVGKPKVMVLQDWILVAFAVAYIFFSVVAVIYVSSKSEYPMRAGIAMAALMVVVTAVMYSWVSYLA